MADRSSQGTNDSHYLPLTVGEHKQELQRSIKYHQRVIKLMTKANPEDPHIDVIKTIVGAMEEELAGLKQRESEDPLFPDNG